MRTSHEIQTLNFRLNLIGNSKPKYIFESESNMMKVGFREEYLKSLHGMFCYVNSGFISVLKIDIQFTAPKFC